MLFYSGIDSCDCIYNYIYVHIYTPGFGSGIVALLRHIADELRQETNLPVLLTESQNWP